MTTHSVSIRLKGIALAVLFLLAPPAFPQVQAEQNVERVFHFTYTDDVQNYQQMATVIRSTLDIKQLSIDAGNRTMTLRATPEQIAAAEWLFRTLDRTAGSEATESPEYRMPGNDDDTVRIFYLTKAETVEALQQQATRIRSATGFRRAFTYNVLRALVVRGTAEQVAHAERLITEL
jgi:hypothetical protein